MANCPFFSWNRVILQWFKIAFSYIKDSHSFSLLLEVQPGVFEVYLWDHSTLTSRLSLQFTSCVIKDKLLYLPMFGFLNYKVGVIRGRFTMKPIKDLRIVFTCLYIFEKFAKVKYFNHTQLRTLSLPIPIFLLSLFPWSYLSSVCPLVTDGIILPVGMVGSW